MQKDPGHNFNNQAINTQQLPSIENLPYQQLSPLYPRLAATQALLLALIPVTIITVLLLTLPSETIQSPDAFTGLLFTFVLLFVFGIVYLSFIEARSKQFCLREHDMIVKQGVLIKSTLAQPFLRVQHLEVSQNPLELKLGLATLKLFSAGGFRQSFAVPGLTREQADQLKQFILKYQEHSHE